MEGAIVTLNARMKRKWIRRKSKPPSLMIMLNGYKYKNVARPGAASFPLPFLPRNIFCTKKNGILHLLRWDTLPNIRISRGGERRTVL